MPQMIEFRSQTTPTATILNEIGLLGHGRNENNEPVLTVDLSTRDTFHRLVLTESEAFALALQLLNRVQTLSLTK